VSRIEILPQPGACGAEIRCGPVQDLDDETFREIRQAWLDHLVLTFRGQRITDSEFTALGRRFGPLKRAPINESGGERGDAEDGPEVHVVSNVMANGAPVGILGSGDVAWHTDMVGFLVPPSATLLYALEVPSTGGDTLFMNMYLTYETLPDEVKRRISGLTIKHEVLSGSAGAGNGASHPIVCIHPETGSSALFLGSRHNTFVNELPRPESDDLLALLWTHVMEWRFIGRHRWRAGDVVVWDNRCVAHARQAFDAGSRRVLHRIQVQGTVRPRAAPDGLHAPGHSRARPVVRVP
jgi:taurine dioxygenase